MKPLDVWNLGGDPQRLFGGYMKMQWISGGPKRAAAAMLLALGLGGLAVAGADRLLNPPATFKFASADTPASRISFAPVVKKVLPSVVTITSSRVMKTGFQGGDNGIPPMFRQFFGGDEGNGGGQFRMPRQQREEGLGSPPK
jgi:S1-C subfamily serine protease